MGKKQETMFCSRGKNYTHTDTHAQNFLIQSNHINNCQIYSKNKNVTQSCIFFCLFICNKVWEGGIWFFLPNHVLLNTWASWLIGWQLICMATIAAVVQSVHQWEGLSQIMPKQFRSETASKWQSNWEPSSPQQISSCMLQSSFPWQTKWCS